MVQPIERPSSVSVAVCIHTPPVRYTIYTVCALRGGVRIIMYHAKRWVTGVISWIARRTLAWFARSIDRGSRRTSTCAVVVVAPYWGLSGGPGGVGGGSTGGGGDGGGMTARYGTLSGFLPGTTGELASSPPRNLAMFPMRISTRALVLNCAPHVPRIRPERQRVTKYSARHIYGEFQWFVRARVRRAHLAAAAG
jgi:hypothetical protein